MQLPHIFGGRPLNKSSAAYVQTSLTQGSGFVGGGIACQRQRAKIAARNVPLLLKRGVIIMPIISHSAAANAIKSESEMSVSVHQPPAKSWLKCEKFSGISL